MKILLVNAHPLFTNENSTTVKLLTHTQQKLAENPENSVETINLYDENFYIPSLDKNMFQAWGGDENQKNILDAQKRIVTQFMDADAVFFFSPLYNYNITAKTKDYIDNLVLTNITFKYTSEGMVGLLNPNQKIVYVQASGSEYTNDPKMEAIDFPAKYISAIMKMLGISEIKIIRAEGMGISKNNKEEIIANAKKEISSFINAL